MAKRSNEEIIAAIHKTKGMITLTAQELGISYNTLRSYIDKSEALQRAMKETHDSMLDAAELKLYSKAVVEGDTTALIFLLKTKGKQRGYVERVENTGANGGPVETILRIQYGDMQPFAPIGNLEPSEDESE